MSEREQRLAWVKARKLKRLNWIIAQVEAGVSVSLEAFFDKRWKPEGVAELDTTTFTIVVDGTRKEGE